MQESYEKGLTTYSIVFAGLLCASSPPLIAQVLSPAPTEFGSRETWHASMSRTPLPRKGCFEASYPSTEWQEVPCTTPPSYPLGRTHVGGPNPNTVGGGGNNDFAAQVSGLILTAEGSFSSVTPGITETGNTYNGCSDQTGTNVPNAFTLQLNSNTFTNQATEAICANGATPTSCMGWQQFVFDNNAKQAYIQYWLENYGTAASICPAGGPPGGWHPFSPSSNVIDCYGTTNGMGNIPSQTMAHLPEITMTATSESGATDTLLLQTASGDLYASASDSLLNLAQSWHAAEFNIFGDGCLSQANFSSGSTIVVKTSVDDKSLDTPKCVAESFTGETDNLTLVPPCCPYGGASPAIEFMESNAAFPTATCGSSGLQAFTSLHSFSFTDGEYPNGLVQATNGDLYGTTNFGSEYSGTVFKITPSGTLTTVYSFCSQSGCTDGDGPLAGLVQATNGDLYGTTGAGGANHGGTVFKITPSGTLTTLYSFCDYGNPCPEGSYPVAGLVQATNGDLYGTTYWGGANGNFYGTIFKITPSGTLTTVYSFCSQGGCTDGSEPAAGLVQATNGNLYGTTEEGGANNAGTVFKITPSGTLTTLYSFCSQGGCMDGESPVAGLVQATNGNLYGTTKYGGANLCLYSPGCGTVFKITPSGTLTTLYSFCSQFPCPDGYDPVAGLIQATDGDLYGTTWLGGTSVGGGAVGLYGTVFSLSVGLRPFVETLPTFGQVGAHVTILGTNLIGATSVTFNGTPQPTFTVNLTGTAISTTVPAGATTGKVQVVTPGDTLSSDVLFRVP